MARMVHDDVWALGDRGCSFFPDLKKPMSIFWVSVIPAIWFMIGDFFYFAKIFFSGVVIIFMNHFFLPMIEKAT